MVKETLLETCGKGHCWGMAGHTLLERSDPHQGWDTLEELQPIGDLRQGRDNPEGLQPMDNPHLGRGNQKEGGMEKQKKRTRSKEWQKSATTH